MAEEALRDGDGSKQRATTNSSAKNRAAPGDTLREELAMMRLGPSSSGTADRSRIPSHPEAPRSETPPQDSDEANASASHTTESEALAERARSMASKSAQRRAAPGDTLKEELAVMRLGGDSDRGRMGRTERSKVESD